VTMVEILTNDLLALHERIKQAGAHIDKEPVFTNDFGYFTLKKLVLNSKSFSAPSSRKFEVLEQE
jgi:hypothetical protein